MREFGSEGDAKHFTESGNVRPHTPNVILPITVDDQGSVYCCGLQALVQ